MLRLWFLPLLMFVGFYALFWNVKHWNLSAWRLAGLSALCAGIASVATAVAVLFITVVFN